MKKNLDLRHRSLAEELWLWRKSKGLDCATAAERFQMSRTVYWRAEKGTRSPPSEGWDRLISPSERLLMLLARRRSRLGVEKLAKRLKTSRPTLLAWEREQNQALKAFWRSQGYVF